MIQDKFPFGQDTNDTDLVFLGEKKPDEARQPLTLLRVIEMKAAAYEGWLTYLIYIEREKEDLPLEARHLFSVYSPLEFFPLTPEIFSVSIYDRKEYLFNREKALSYCKKEVKEAIKGSFFWQQIMQASELIRLQLYGFGRAALQKGKIMMAREAFRIADLLGKEQIKEHLARYKDVDHTPKPIFETI